MLGATGAPAGTLTLNAATVAVASQAALTDIAAAADVSARNSRLAVNDGAVSDQGYLTAGAMRFSVGRGSTSRTAARARRCSPPAAVLRLAMAA